MSGAGRKAFSERLFRLQPISTQRCEAAAFCRIFQASSVSIQWEQDQPCCNVDISLLRSIWSHLWQVMLWQWASPAILSCLAELPCCRKTFSPWPCWEKPGVILERCFRGDVQLSWGQWTASWWQTQGSQTEFLMASAQKFLIFFLSFL